MRPHGAAGAADFAEAMATNACVELGVELGLDEKCLE
jgi:hypothetical protein